MIYFILPVYNEEENIRPLITQIREMMKENPCRIIAVNDGSSDQSPDILKELKGDDLCVDGSVINMNVGAVFSAGLGRVLKESTHDDDVVFIIESDQTSELKYIPRMIKSIQGGEDVVIASRYKQDGAYQNFPFLRQVFSYCANHMMQFYFPINDVEDYTIFFRAYRVGLLRKATGYFGSYGLIQSKGFVANAELLIKLSFLTDKITEIPFIYNYAKKKGQSKIRIFRTINEYFVLVSYLRRISKKVRSWKESKGIEGRLP